MSNLILPPSCRNTRSQDLGSETFVYYENRQGRIIIPVNPEDRRIQRPGYERREARSVQAAEKISARFRKQMQDDRARMSVADRTRMEVAENKLRDSLKRTMAQSSCSNYERDVIRTYLKRMDEGRLKKRETAVEGFLHSEGFEAGR